ncbi:trichodiene synthase [Ophiocordyceps camponoti-floridani]|uniref:Trichodiene synthase n=1 Tax=Ophiocordyceps camponoti-floridani TaxID=2030778 RepID=A0A8H4QCZ0_9HYPO|nr:trichodiene synthase [Ophiocordyceps camponoti-floridani]
MSFEPFPVNDFKRIIVDVLDTIRYSDTNYDTREDRVSILRFVYSEAVKHFAQPQVRETLHKKVETIDKVLRSTACVIVCCSTRASSKLRTVLTIYFTYLIIFDDSQDDLRPSMQGLLEDMVTGRPQGYPWLKLVNDQFLQVMKYYGPFCSLGIYRNTIDFVQGRWIEMQDFTGFRGPGDYPNFLRRLSCLGHSVAASLLPADQFDEGELLVEMTAAICLVEKGMIAINDLLSFYKEYEEGDETSWAILYAEVNGVSQTEALAQLASNIVSVSNETSTVFSEKAFMAETVTRFIHGYITWHLSDPRYRMRELIRAAEDDDIGLRFDGYVDRVGEFAGIDPAEWAVPSLSMLTAEKPALTRDV